MFDQYLKRVVGGECLSAEEACASARMLLHDSIPDIQAAAFLSALRTRKESQTELSGFVQAIYEEALVIESDQELLDTCGTGGDGMGTFNISTTAALVVASCGVSVAKHGNRAVTGKVGSADVLEALGVNIQLRPDEARKCLEQAGITFLFAPNYHPILKEVGPLRRQLGITTIFNFLGPLLNPMKLSYQVIGIADAGLQEALAYTLQQQGRTRSMVVIAENGMDEVSPMGPTRVYEIDSCGGKRYDIHPEELGINEFPMACIRGGDAQINAMIVKKVLEGEKGACRDTVLLNAAAALMTAGRARDMHEGMLVAGEAIDAGKAKATLQALISYSRDGVVVC